MLNIGVITWRLGNSTICNLERLVLPEQKKKETLKKLSHDYNGICYISSCQRIILVVGVSNEMLLDNLKKDYLEELGISDSINEEKYVGTHALRHLGEVIASLDSITLGEDQIQHQFKEAFDDNIPYMSNILKFLLQRVIRLGKRVRNLPVYNKGRISTISMVVKSYHDEFRRASSIGIVGTGKMGREILKGLENYKNKLVIYSRSEKRSGDKLVNRAILRLEEMHHHDILLLVTDAVRPIINRDFLIERGIHPSLIFDLSLPRNCDDDVLSIDDLQLYRLSDLLIESKYSTNDEEIKTVFEFLNAENRKIILEYLKYAKSEIFTSLRKDIQTIANDNKMSIINGNMKAERQYDLMVKKMLHISQTHIEELIRGSN
ncbi:MAG: hypothetical protein GPJ54_08755 [Candidatus Heimdallarchaeota archaeon]|nr:hypothetical protein [Candidatus Heimdallarchaeota archaeon]